MYWELFIGEKWVPTWNWSENYLKHQVRFYGKRHHCEVLFTRWVPPCSIMFWSDSSVDFLFYAEWLSSCVMFYSPLPVFVCFFCVHPYFICSLAILYLSQCFSLNLCWMVYFLFSLEFFSFACFMEFAFWIVVVWTSAHKSLLLVVLFVTLSVCFDPF